LKKMVKIGKHAVDSRRFSQAQELAMEPKLSRAGFIAAMRQQMEEVLGQVADAVNAATPGHIINGSEEKVRDLFAKLREQAYQQAVQLRVDAAEAAFPPSAGSPQPQDQKE
jgi:hypothetical protein